VAGLPPIVATLIADTKEFMAKMDEAQGKVAEFGGETEAAGGKLASFASKASTAVLGVGVALGAYAVDQAFKFQEGMDKLGNQTNLTKGQLDRLGTSIQNISNLTGVSNSDLQTSAISIYQAGYKGAQATKILTDAAKASVITNASVADTTQAIIAAQTLQVAKGMDVSKLTGVLVRGSKEFVGGLSAEEQMLSGRVGVALAKYHLGLKTIIPLGAEFAKVGLPTRSIASFASALGNLQKPMTDSKGKLTTYAQGLEKVGLSQATLGEDLRKGNIVGILTQIKDVATASGQPLSQVADAVFGTTGGASASVLVNNLKNIASLQKNMTGAGAKSLQSGFEKAVHELGPQLKVLKANFDNLMVNAGKLILPAISDIVGWVNSFAGELRRNPVLRDVFGVGLATVFVAAVGIKLKSVFDTIKGVLSKTSAPVTTEQGISMIDLLTNIDINTAKIAGGSALGGGGGGGVSTAETTGGEVAGGGAAGAGALGAAGIATVLSGLAAAVFGLLIGAWAGKANDAANRAKFIERHMANTNWTASPGTQIAGTAANNYGLGKTNVTVHVHAR
jgi:TP901 family phage tail tape measure protein